MENTGERHIPSLEIKDEAEYYNHLMHIATYRYALQFANNKQVLDYGCGSGYGSFMLSKVSDRITAIDISEETLLYAKNTYKAENLSFKNLSELSDEKYDIITAFQVIEHVRNSESLIRKLRSLLNPGGLLLVSTPDRKNRLFKLIQRPWNIFHYREFSDIELKKTLQNYFENVEILRIGSDSDLVLKEIARTRKQRLISLPCTMIIYPDILRVRLLSMQVHAFSMIKKIRNRDRSQKTYSIHHQDFNKAVFQKEIEISGRIKHSTDLFAICS
ncbi:MAG TPA: class I SAM-dependent methyltransferase [Bacteroidales bacterium]|nr:class I SAM-dependent methyltransferase [Bacteroidales bacterium]